MKERVVFWEKVKKGNNNKIMNNLI
jgi:hypothetical protein